MPGCPSKFSRQDNMMQHYRTHVSPKSRRGVPKSKEFKEYKEYYGLGNASQERLAHVSGGSRDQSPAASLTRRGSAELDAQIHFYNAAKIATARQGSRQNSPPRFNPLDRSGSVDYMGRSPSENHGSSVGGTLRHKHSGILQTHQHHTPLPHFNIQAVAMNHPSTQSPPSGPSSTLPSPLTPSIQQPAVYQQQQQQSGYLPAPHGAHAPSTKYLSETHGSYPSESVLASPTSPFTRDVERMEGVTPSYEHEPRHPHQAQQHYHHSYHHQSTQPSHPSSYPGHPQITPAYHTHPSQQHAGHASAGHLPSSTQHHHSSHPTSSHSAYQLPPLTIQGNRQDQGPTHSDSKSYSSSSASDPSSMYGNSNGNHRHGTKHAAPLSPQSTPHTPTKYRFDPIQDCLQQDKHSHPHHAYPRESHIGGDTRMRYDDEESGSTTRSSGISSMSSMTSISSASSSSMSIAGQQQQHRQHGQNIQMSGEARHDKPVKQENPEELSSLAHLAQIVTTYG
ncbi:hypothetical protein BGW38_006925 [Lunasporangiospora selenospora]|uniref:Uncharacterized protein n=1 Tax=Lunasporangiospora selenospora TaxID=979761 RepID=A0A9P6FLA1_9FUNG|nr:hypothetical protein BGW38_006925 [Lunasporangiospora selenospora]